MSDNSESLLNLFTGGVLIHHGGEADIYRVSANSHDYILKWYRTKEAFHADTLQKISTLNNEGLYKIREAGERENHSYVIYDYVPGISCEDVPLTSTASLYVLRQVVKTLIFLKKKGLYHGDLSPANILLCTYGEKLQPVLIDCGIIGPGALAYVAPERFQGKAASEKSDIYSLGMLLFRLVSGAALIDAGDYDQYAAASLNCDGLSPSEKLYVSGKFSAVEIAALAPIWNGTLRADAENRVEDLDELDELLEIALDKIADGEIAIYREVQSLVEIVNSQKSLQKVPDVLGSPLPYEISGVKRKFSSAKILVFSSLVLILILLGIFVAHSENANVDSAGDMVLQRSRNLKAMEVSTENVQKGSPETDADSNLLKDLPTPQKRE